MGKSTDARARRSCIRKVVDPILNPHPAAPTCAGGSGKMIDPTSVPYNDVIGGYRDIPGNGGSIPRRVVDDGILPRGYCAAGPVTPRIPIGAGGSTPVCGVGNGKAKRGDQSSEDACSEFL